MLPTVLPMLATASSPFDASPYSFEVKWDGVRMLAAVEASGWRLWGRAAADYTARYPELAVLRRLPPGTLVDGECVAFAAHGVPDLALLLKRHGLTNPWKIGQAWRWCAVRYVLFDLLYYRGRCLMRQPLSVRREALAEACAGLDAPEVAFSSGVVGAGKAFFAAALAQGHEGVLAKHLASAYRPGQRSATWRKIKPHAR
jgi:bifunctional non-homologous end joining protein LigD